MRPKPDPIVKQLSIESIGYSRLCDELDGTVPATDRFLSTAVVAALMWVEAQQPYSELYSSMHLQFSLYRDSGISAVTLTGLPCHFQTDLLRIYTYTRSTH